MSVVSAGLNGHAFRRALRALPGMRDPHAEERASRSAAAGPRIAAESLRGAALWLIGFAGAFVFIEPSPYELAALGTMLLFALTGLSLRAALTPMALLLVLMNIGHAIAVVPVAADPKAVNWVLISVFLSLTAIFYAAMLGENTQRRLELLMSGYVAAALIASLVATAAYFRLLGGTSDMFMLYGRARGTFNDPNVLGAFLILPGLLMFQRMLAGRLAVRSTLMLLMILMALFLTFSRAAWAQFAFAAMALMAMVFVTSRSTNERFRILIAAALGILAIALVVMALLSIQSVSQLFNERAALEQSYDVGRYGRFGRYGLAAQLALEHPLGIGPLQFYRLVVEDPHNTFLNAFMSGGWLAGLGYLALCAVTLTMGARFVLARTPWQPLYQAIYAAYVGMVAESVIIDIDHWRHYFLILGALWGLMGVTSRYIVENTLPFSGNAGFKSVLGQQPSMAGQ